MKSLIFSFLILSNLSICFGNNSYFSGQGRFYAHEDDSLGFVKNQLIGSAFKDIISKSLEKMNLDPNQFWSKFDKQFNDYFKVIKESLERKYRHGDKKQTWQEKKELKSLLRRKRLLEYKSFAGIERAITSYTIKKISRSPHYPKSRYMSIEAKVDESMVNSIYHRFVGDIVGRDIKRVFLVSNFQLKNAGWVDLGVESREALSVAVNSHWKNWLEQRLKGHVEEVVVADESIRAQIMEYQNREQSQWNTPTVAVEEPVPASPTPQLSESLVLKVNITMERDLINKFLKVQSYTFSGDIFFLDLKTNSPLLFKELSKETKSYNFMNLQEYSSSIASYIYRMPLGEFDNLKTVVRKLPEKIGRQVLIVSNLSNYKHYKQLQDELSNSILKIRAEVKTQSYEVGRGTFVIEYHGELDDLKSAVEKLDNKKTNFNSIITFPSKSDPFLIKMEAGLNSSVLENGVSDEFQQQEIQQI